MQVVQRVPPVLRRMVDQVVGDHALRVAVLASTLASCTGTDAADAALAGFLHDVGKASIPRFLLEKPGPLTPEERSVMCGHVSEGVRLILAFWSDVPAVVVAGVAGHHERLCGTGYPLGVRHLGDVAAVVAVADVYDALTMDRVYRPALGPREALAQLEREHLPPGPVAALGAHLGFGTLPVDVSDA